MFFLSQKLIWNLFFNPYRMKNPMAYVYNEHHHLKKMAYIIYLFSDYSISRLRSPVIQKPLQTNRATSNVESAMYGGLLRDQQCALNIC